MDVEITDRRDSIVVSASARTADDWGSIPHRVVLFFQRLVPSRETISLYLIISLYSRGQHLFVVDLQINRQSKSDGGKNRRH